MVEPSAHDAAPRIDEHFDPIHANLIRCEECNENFFFDFLRHPRYFVTHFKTCHLKNVLYRVNGCSEEENQRVRFGPRRKKDAMAWFSQLKSTEKRMISMQDNKWGEIAERECWSCRLYVAGSLLNVQCTHFWYRGFGRCKQARKGSDVPHAFEQNEQGRRQALVHLRQYHEVAYTAFLQMLPTVDAAAPTRASPSRTISWAPGPVPKGVQHVPPACHSVEAERSRLRRKKATPEAKKAEAARSKRRREQLTPAQRQVDAERRARKRQRLEDRARRRLRRVQATPDVREREMKRSRERRQHATAQQRQREAQRSRVRRLNATEEQRTRERERCRRRYELQKQQKRQRQQEGGRVDPTDAARGATSTEQGVRAKGVRPADLAQRNEQLVQQQMGLGLQIRSLCAARSHPTGDKEG